MPMVEDVSTNIQRWRQVHERLERLILEKEHGQQELHKRMLKFIRDKLQIYAASSDDIFQDKEEEDDVRLWKIVHYFVDEEEYYQTLWRRIANEFDIINDMLLDCSAFQIQELNSEKVIISFDPTDAVDEDAVRRYTIVPPASAASKPQYL